MTLPDRTAVPLEPLNRSLFAALNASHASPGVIAALETLAAAPVWLLPLLVAGAWLLGRRADRLTAVMAGLAGCLSMVVAHAASATVDHPRPFMIGLAPNLLGHAADSSFPSDHATLFFALAILFGRRPLSGLPGLGWLLACLGLGVGFARVALGVHFPLDIVGAIAIGAGAGLATDAGLEPLGLLLFRLGERLRCLVKPLAKRDRRETAGTADAHPAG